MLRGLDKSHVDTHWRACYEPNECDSIAIFMKFPPTGGAAVKERIREIDKEYGFNLTEDEIESIAKQAEETHKLLQDLYKVDVTGVMPIMKIDKQRKS